MSSEIAADFKTVPCNEYCQRIADGTHDSPKETEHGRRLVTSKNVKNGRLVLDSAYLISEADFNEINRRSKVDRWDLLLTMIGTVGEVCVVEQADPDFAIKNVGLLKCGAEHRAKWLYYFLRSPQGQGLIEQRKKGSTQQYISLTEIRNLPISYPGDEAELRGMVSALSMLDDRITLLRETNATLEAIAQALFKSWFVDFDPVRAKMAGRTPEGMDEATAALFPDALEETEWGLMPRGWHVSRVGDVAEVVKGKSYSSKDLAASHDTALVTLKSFERGGGFRMDGFKPYVGVYKPTQVVQAGDLIVAYTDVTQAAELIGKPAIVVGVDAFSTLVASLDVGIVRPDPARSTKLFLYGLFNTDTFQAHTLAHTSGTTVLHLAKDGVGSFVFPCPPMALIERFERVASDLVARKQVNSDAISTLSELRDTLLPRLISGQLRLPEMMEAKVA